MSQNPDVAVLPVPGPPGATVPEHRVGRLILKNSTIVIVVTFAQKVLSLFLFRALALHYGPATFGDWNTAFAFLSFFGIITDAGIDTIVVREASRTRPDLDRFIGTAILAKLALAGLAYTICLGLVFVMPYRLDLKLLILLAAVPMFASFNTIYADVLQANMKIGYIKTVGMVTSLLLVAGGFLVIWLKGDLFALAGVNIVVAIPAIILYQRMARLVSRPAFVIDLAIFKDLFKEALPLAFSGAFGIIYYRIDTVLLSLFKAGDSVGYYAATYKLTEALNVIPGAVMISVFPVLARYAQNPALQDQTRRVYLIVFKYMLMLILPIVLGVTILAEPLIQLIYSSAYLPAAAAMRLIIWAEIPMFVNPVTYQLLIAYGHQRPLLVTTFVMASFNIGSNLLAIPLMGFTGTALITSLTEFVGLIFGFWFLHRILRIGTYRVLWSLLLSLVPLTGCLGLTALTENPFFALLGAGLYVGSLRVSGSLHVHELRGLLF
jgi:O-antigen/teichoic acid export membrane protein